MLKEIYYTICIKVYCQSDKVVKNYEGNINKKNKYEKHTYIYATSIKKYIKKFQFKHLTWCKLKLGSLTYIFTILFKEK